MPDSIDIPQDASEASDWRLRSVVDRAHDAFVAMDADGVIVDWNPAAERIFGWSREEAVGELLGDLIIPEGMRAAHERGVRRFLDTGEARLLDRRVEMVALRRGDRQCPVEFTVAAEPSPTGLRFFAFLHDISERKLTERLLRAQAAVAQVFAEAHGSEEAMEQLLVGLGQAMGWRVGAWWAPADSGDVLRCRAFWRAEDGDALEFEALSRALPISRGVGLPGRVWASGEPAWLPDVRDDPNFPRAEAALGAGLRAGVCVPVVGDPRIEGAMEFFSTERLEPDAGTRQILSAVAAQIGGFVSLLAERSELISKLEHLALTDELTGLGNRRAWEDSLERELVRARREEHPLCVALIDLDHFKRFNDVYGHQAGDRLLRDLATAWKRQLRASDVLARYGGEEFACLIPANTVEAAHQVVERLRSAVPLDQTCSAGLAIWDGEDTGEELVGRADVALYEAKSRGRNRSVIARA